MPEVTAWQNLITFKGKVGEAVSLLCEKLGENWDILSTFFEYPTEIRKIRYTTNIFEGLNRQFRQITKHKPSFTLVFSGRETAFTLRVHTVSHPET